MKKTENTAQPDTTPWWKRKLQQKLYPTKRMVWDLPEWAKDGINVETTITLSFISRVAVLFSGRIKSIVFIKSSTILDRLETKSVAYPLPPFI